MDYRSSLKMHAGFCLHRKRRELIVSVLLLALTLRALVPAGFMPAADHGFSLEICPDGFPAQLLHYDMHHEHGAGGAAHHHGSSRPEHCVFAAVAGAATAASTLVVLVALESTLTPLLDTTRSARRTERFHIRQPRAPPPPA
jgi:Protein of unknown function (DUF2946)